MKDVWDVRDLGEFGPKEGRPPFSILKVQKIVFNRV